MTKYRWITELLGIDPVRDYAARDKLWELLKDFKDYRRSIADLIRNKNIIVLGAGPSLDEMIMMLYEHRHCLHDSVIIAADTAVKPLVLNGLIPDIIVSDLDGDLDSLMYAADKGSILVVHAHGDNIDRVMEYVPLFMENNYRIIGTTQVEPLGGIVNYGGFTDGDRAVYLALHHDPARLIIGGMDYGHIIGKYSIFKFKENPAGYYAKIVKLEIMRDLLGEAACRSNTPIYNFSHSRYKCMVNYPLERDLLLSILRMPNM